jgi:hypothetical protein
VTDLLFQKAKTVRAGARGDEDYDVVADGTVIGRILKRPRRLLGHPGCGY